MHKGWFIVAISFIVYFVCDGLTFSFGLIFIEILHHFGYSTGRTSLIASFINCLPLLYSPLTCSVIKTFGFRKCLIFGGIMTALSFCCSFFISNFHLLQFVYGFILTFGFSIAYLCAYMIIPYWFKRNIGLATGITVSGSGIGQLSFSFFIQYLLKMYGWQGTSLIIGGIFFNVPVLGICVKIPHRLPLSEIVSTDPDEQEQGTELLNIADKTPGALKTESNIVSTTNQQVSNKTNMVMRLRAQLRVLLKDCQMTIKGMLRTEVLNNLKLWILYISNFLIMLVFSIPYVFLADFMDINGTNVNLAIPYALMGAFTTLGHVSFGRIADKKILPAWLFYAITLFLAGLSNLLLLLKCSPALIIIFSILFGYFASPCYVYMLILIIEAVDNQYVSEALGVTQFFQGIGTLIGIPICGLLKDLSGNYKWSYLFTAVGFILSAVIMLPWPFLSRRRAKPITSL